jgi:hypothetical protein
MTLDSTLDAPLPAEDRDGDSTLHRAARAARRQLRAGGFWAAVCLPFLHVPLLLTGLDSTGDAAAFAALLVANLLALVVGHGHRTA